MSPEVTVPSGETVELFDRSLMRDVCGSAETAGLHVAIDGGPVRLASQKSEAPAGEYKPSGWEGTINSVRDIYAHAPTNADATVSYNRKFFTTEDEPTPAGQSNHSDVAVRTESIADGDGTKTLPSFPVPEGVGVMIHNPGTEPFGIAHGTGVTPAEPFEVAAGEYLPFRLYVNDTSDIDVYYTGANTNSTTVVFAWETSDVDAPEGVVIN